MPNCKNIILDAKRDRRIMKIETFSIFEKVRWFKQKSSLFPKYNIFNSENIIKFPQADFFNFSV